MRLLVDMNLSPAWVAFLSQAGFDAAHWSTLGSAGASDHEIMAHAKLNGYVMLTHDLDFSAILALRGATNPALSKSAPTTFEPM